ncbi:hypothetical protein DB32_006617 [Sandaracinus amylolyticus]|uniref:Uncharacterized protein n=1 Tax=Sandaracinus amylolyticus TaxID=927083 RepID=A0A0F6W7H1_9BACT|nr:hypothetical protein DB32_006617 [Sandaracinus amylolyticus]
MIRATMRSAPVPSALGILGCRGRPPGVMDVTTSTRESALEPLERALP